MSMREDFVRPRSERENAARRAAIIDAAEALVMESSNQRFSIGDIAKRVGVSQSTIFLHFRNREELLTTLYVGASKKFFETFVSKLHEGMSDRAFCEAFADTMVERPAFRLMRPGIMRVVKASLNKDYILEAVKESDLFREAVADQVDEIMKLKPGEGRILMKAFVNLMCGAVQTDISGFLATEHMDEAVAERIQLFDFRYAFLCGSELLMKGVRVAGSH
nr:helix-turn-helix domain-containing protein [uncultured Hyphomonas sp.]